MTRATKKALKSVGVPAVRWSEQYRQYFARIGYRRSKSGKRQRAFFYFGDDERAAVAHAVAKKTEWRKLTKRHPIGDAVWTNDAAPAVDDAEIERIEAENTADAIESGEVAWAKPNLTLTRLAELYGAYRKGKIGVGGAQGLKQSTYDDEQRNLRLALAHADAEQTIDAIGYAEIENWKDAIFRRVGAKQNGIRKRTAINYCRAIKAMLDWCHRTVIVPYRHPEDFAKIFHFKKIKSIDIEPYDKAKMLTLLKKATPRERLYVLLALNCGHYQVDIGSLRRDQIIDHEGRHAIIRKREKTSHQNDFESLHVLWDETYSLLMAELAPKNPHGLALLNDASKPLYRSDDDGKYDGIGHAYQRLKDKAGVKIAFKMFRKIGTSAMERLGGAQPRRLYKAGTIEGGDDVYVLEAFQNLTPHLDRWGDELRADGVLSE